MPSSSVPIPVRHKLTRWRGCCYLPRQDALKAVPDKSDDDFSLCEKRQFDDFELSRDRKAQLKLVQQWLARQRSKTNANNSNSTPEVLEPNVGETNELAKNIEIKQETDKSTEDIILKEDETDKLAKDFENKEGTDKLDKKRAEVSRGAAKRRRKRNKKKKLEVEQAPCFCLFRQACIWEPHTCEVWCRGERWMGSYQGLRVCCQE